MILDGKVVLIAGGRGALGQTVTPAFVQAGAHVIVIDRRSAGEASLGEMGLDADVTDERSVTRAVDEALSHAGRIDCLVNLVGGFTAGHIADTPPTAWNSMLAINLTAAYLLSHAVLPQMTQQRSGCILHIAARAAQDPFAGAGAYIVAKSGLIALIKVLSLELQSVGVTVNGILPTTIDTPANRRSMPSADTSKWVNPASIAELLIFLSSDGAHRITGALIPIG